ncbi:MAG: 3-phosphoshikimate 1-carboxyvinyltransferase [Pedosphaera sp.]|nr:3-phosphoshikimate 1-carboxyvinyltransferase [Pedosphaera sp.]
MPLPDLIEIVPLTSPVRAEITVPGSKSITNRALVLAALAGGETALQGALWSEDTQVMVECLQEIGFMVNVEPDPDETCNRTITVYGLGGKVPRGGTVEQPLELFVGNAGTAARFLAAMVCLGEGVYKLHGVPRMHERPQAALFGALRELGYRVDSPNDRLPALIHGGSGSSRGHEALTKTETEWSLLMSAATRKTCRVSIEESSQFASALLLGAITGGWKISVTGENAEESPYVQMTSELVKVFPQRGGVFEIEPDASSGSYFWAAGSLLAWSFKTLRTVTVAHWPGSGWQVDSRFRDYSKPTVAFPKTTSRQSDLGDSIMTAIVLAPFAGQPVKFTGLGRLRQQECERVVALRTELTRCGARAIETGDTLEVFPSSLHGAEIETYDDHRMAMCFAVLGLKIPGIKIKNPACVKKTFPNFFQKLAAPPPHGLSAEIHDGRTGRKLEPGELFAD